MKAEPWIYRLVVSTLSLTVMGCLVGTVWLSIHGKENPDLLTGLGTGALGALAGVLAPTPLKP